MDKESLQELIVSLELARALQHSALASQADPLNLDRDDVHRPSRDLVFRIAASSFGKRLTSVATRYRAISPR